MPDALTTVRALLARVKGMDADRLPPETDIQSLQLDSLDILEVVMGIEETFDVELDPTRFADCRTLADIVRAIEA